MNLHKAKGLEANVVFLADPTGGFGIRVDTHIERQGLIARGWFKVERKSEGSYVSKLLGEHADWPAHEAAEKPYREAEEDRLLYVAATRAREMLVVSRYAGDQRNPAWGVLNDFLDEAKELTVPSSAMPPAVHPLDCSKVAQSASDAARIAAHDRAREPSWSIGSVTAEARHIARITRTVEAAADDPTKVVGRDTPAHRADAGIAWGTLIHGLLEHAMRHQSARREDLQRLAMWLTVDEPQLRDSLDVAIDTVLRVARADFWEAARAGEHSEETPFAVLKDAALTIGVIDLLFKSRMDGSCVTTRRTSRSTLTRTRGSCRPTATRSRN